MTISLNLLEYLEWEEVEYELLPHAYISGSLNSAQLAHVPGDQVAKCVVLEDELGYLMAVLPATHHVELDSINDQLHRNLQMATETEIEGLFDDCSRGAIPPIAEAYGYEAIVDDSLDDCEDVYFEAGDHSEFVHVSGEDFNSMMNSALHGHFSHHI